MESGEILNSRLGCLSTSSLTPIKFATPVAASKSTRLNGGGGVRVRVMGQFFWWGEVGWSDVTRESGTVSIQENTPLLLNISPGRFQVPS